MKIFTLRRKENQSGVSGTVRVAEGVVFESGKAVLSWLTKNTSVAIYDSIEALIAAHGHEGLSEVVWADGPPILAVTDAIASLIGWRDSSCLDKWGDELVSVVCSSLCETPNDQIPGYHRTAHLDFLALNDECKWSTVKAIMVDIGSY